MGAHNEFGKLGEDLAVDYLLGKGYLIRERNYRYLKGEIDIIAEKDEVLVIVEVKSRSSNYLEDIAATVNEKKIRLLVATADHYIVTHEVDLDSRFDIVTILKKEDKFVIDHLKDAFFHF